MSGEDDDSDLVQEIKMSGIIGNIGEFDPNEEQWDSYIERFELFLLCNEIKDNKKVCTLLTVIGVKTFNLLRDLCTPEKPQSKSYEQLIKIIKDHLYPKPSVIAERYKFSQRNQLDNETVAQYVANLKKFSTHCEFGTNLNDYLRDRLVSGIRSESVKQRLLSETDLTFEKAVALISSIEAAEKNAASLQYGSAESSGRVQRLVAAAYPQRMTSGKQGAATSLSQSAAPRNQQQHPSKVQVQCYCCGQNGHFSKECKFRGCKCNFCGKRNHLAKVCRARLSGKNMQSFNSNKTNYGHENSKGQFKRVQNKSHNYVETVDEKTESDGEIIDDVSNIFTMNENVNKPEKVNRVEPFKVNLLVENKSVTFEIDTGASVSVISDQCYKEIFSDCQLLPSNLTLSSYTNVPIVPVGKINVQVNYQGSEHNLDLYVVKDGAHPLMGRDWIKELKLEISFNKDILFVEKNITKYEKTVTSKLTDDIIKEFPDVFTDQLGEFKSEPVKLHLKENSVPKYLKPRALPFTLKAKVEKELDRLVEADVLCPVKSAEWGTPIVPILKKDGSIRICGDFKVTLNPNLVVDHYPIPRIEDLFNEMDKGELFSKLDLSQAYMQLKLDNESQKLCTISTHKGMMAYKRMPYGISSAPGIFQRKIEQTLQGLQGVKVFLDDLLISAPDNETHVKRLREVCDRLKSVGFTVKKEKCKFFAPKLEFLGFTIDKDGLHTSEAKVKAITDAPLPRNVTEVKSFIGLVTYYAKFVPNLSCVLKPMYNLLKKDVPFVFNKECVNAFNQVKQLLSTAPVLAHYDPAAPAVLTVDASSAGLGCVLSIFDKNGVERPVSYSSRTLSPAETHYSQIDKEALAVVYGVKKFHQYLYGRHFLLRSDHKPLLSIFGPKKGLPVFAASRLQRYALFLSGYDFEMQYVKSDVNSADALSRLPLNVKHANENVDFMCLGTYLQNIQESSLPITCEEVKTETQKDPMLRKIYGFVMYGWPNYVPNDDRELSVFFQRKDEISVEQGILMWGYKVIIPISLRAYILKELHTSHLGICKMKSVARSYVWWPNIDHDIEALANSCSSCLLERPNPAKSQLHHWHYPSKPWERLHLDYMGPFKGKMYLIIVDAHSKWLEVFETTSTSAKQAIDHLRQLFARFGLPVAVHSDNGPPFNSVEFNSFLSTNGITQTTSAPYHPKSNGQAENSVKYAKSKLKCAFRDNVDVSVALSRILFDYRNSVHSTTNETPAKLMFNRQLRTRLDLLRPNLSSVVERKQAEQKKYAGGSKTRYLYVNQSVLARDYRSSNKWLEGCIVKQISPTMYIVRLSSGIVWKRHIDQLIAIDTTPIVESDYYERKVRKPSVDLTREEAAVRDVTRSPAVRRSILIPTTPSPVKRSADAVNKEVSPHCSAATPPKTVNTDSGRRYPIRFKKPIDRLNL